MLEFKQLDVLLCLNAGESSRFINSLIITILFTIRSLFLLELVELNDLVKKQPNVQEREVWTCKFCSTMFSDVVKFAKHILEHYEKQLLNQCEYCNQTFKAYKVSMCACTIHIPCLTFYASSKLVTFFAEP